MKIEKRPAKRISSSSHPIQLPIQPGNKSWKDQNDRP